MYEADRLRWLVVIVLVQPGFSQTDWHFAGPDIAQGKVASQGPETFLQYYPTLAVDGVIDPNIEHNHCSHTGSSSNAWWAVELGNPFIVKGIRIYNRSNNYGRLKGFRVVGNPGDVELYNDGKADSPKYLDMVIEITVAVTTAFDEVDVEIPGPYLTLCEVQVYAELCQLPQLPASLPLHYRIIGDIVYSGYIPVGAELLFHCEPRIQYELVGSANQTCMANGSYTDTLPKCEQYCQGLPGVANGQYTNVKSSYIPGDFLWFTCDTNFAPGSDSKQICTVSSSWSNPDPVCTSVTCSTPPQLADGHYVLSSGSTFPADGVNVGTIISVVCDTEGFVPVFSTRTCSSDGAWSGEGQCMDAKYIKCSLESLRPAERFYVLDKPYGSSIGYSQAIGAHCELGYMKYSGDESRTCLVNGSLSGTELSCIATQCTTETLHPKDRFYFFDDNYGQAIDYTASITTNCRPAYVWSSGNFSRTCLTNGSFSGTELLCSPYKDPPDDESLPSWAVGVSVGLPELAVFIFVVVAIYFFRRSRFWQNFRHRGPDTDPIIPPDIQARQRHQRLNIEDDRVSLHGRTSQANLLSLPLSDSSMDSLPHHHSRLEAERALRRPQQSYHDRYAQARPAQHNREQLQPRQHQTSRRNDRRREYGATAITEASPHTLPHVLTIGRTSNAFQGQSPRSATTERCPSPAVSMISVSGENTCAVCLDNTGNCCLTCGHMLCDGCARTLRERGEPCPQCRADISDIRLLYPGYARTRNGQPRCETGLCGGRECDCCLDCGHMLCYVCACRLEEDEQRCHVCRNRFTDKRRIYF